ncbi:hypothetical protein IC615_16600 [Serratia ureilytica]
MKTEKLLSPLKVGAVTLPNRVFMAPLTRLRSIEPGDIPTPLMAEYYAQRAGAGLIVTEATQISFQAKATPVRRACIPGADRRVETHHAGGTRQKRPHRRTAVARRPHLPHQPPAGRTSAGRPFGDQRRHPHHRA